MEHNGIFDPLGDSKDGHILARAIISTIQEPLIVLDGDLRVIVASRSFHKKFGLTYKNTHGNMFYDINNGQWNIPPLRILLEKIIPEHTTVEEYEVEHNFPLLGPSTLLVNAREIRDENDKKKILLSIFDITEKRALEFEKEKLLIQKDLLLKEMRHRIANSLQLIASILLLKAEIVDSKESQEHLKDAHGRIMAIATVQEQLDPIARGEDVQVSVYLTALCKSLSQSMIGGRKPITLQVKAEDGTASSDTTVSFGLITTELVINALKHAFPEDRAGNVIVKYETDGKAWTLSISDDGVGISKDKKPGSKGLGTSIIGALANQLQAIIRTESSSLGTTVSIIHTHI